VITEEDLAKYDWAGIDDLLKDEDEQGHQSGIGETKTFAHIAADSVYPDSSTKPVGVPMLGVLKADVDRLGMIFQQGFSDQQRTIARTATLSRQIDMFFKGILPNAIKTAEADTGFRNIYTIYAGGDDLLLVGPWNTILKFATYMRDKFTDYTCSNPSITISAGIAVVKAGFPLSEAARLSETALESSKNKGRNRITIFGQTIGWHEYSQAIDDGSFLDSQLEESTNPDPGSLKITKSFAYRLVKYARMGLRCAEGRMFNITDAKWKSQLAYDIARNITNDKNKDSPQLQRLLEVTNQTENISRLLVAATYCNYKNRRK
jgi:CRISPR-associated protein Csm1